MKIISKTLLTGVFALLAAAASAADHTLTKLRDKPRPSGRGRIARTA